MILSRRPKDNDYKNGFTNWPFMTTHTWGENPRGKWRLIARFQVNIEILKHGHFRSKFFKYPIYVFLKFPNWFYRVTIRIMVW